MNRRDFLKILIIGGGGSLLHRSYGEQLLRLVNTARALPDPQVNTHSSEIVLNSRRSYHSGYSGALSDQILANVLWAASRAPIIGTNRTIYVARPDNVYRYDPVGHDIIVHRTGDHMSETNCAFEVGIASDLAEDAGSALQYAHLASLSFWTTTTDQPSGCPKESCTTNANSSWNPTIPVQMATCFGRMPSVSGITSQLVALSSDGSLPDPSTDGSVILENGLANLKYGTAFENYDVSLNELSQLAWASYGNTPHLTSNSRAGITVASAMADYYLTGRIYIVRSDGVERYHIRLPSGQATTRDHRIEQVTAGDRRPQLRAAIARLPQNAPAYFVYCADAADRWQLLEAGFCAASALLQATSLNLRGYFTANFSPAERTAISSAISIPSSHLPLMIFSVGTPVGINENRQETLLNIAAQPNPFTSSTTIRYHVRSSRAVQLVVYDPAGRVVNILVNRNQQKGTYYSQWNGRDNRKRIVPAGTYHVVFRTGTETYKRKLVKLN